MKVVSDSTSLIHLGKIGKIDLLKRLFEKIIIENEVYKEIIEKGRMYSEVPMIKKLIEEGFILIKEATKQIEMPNLHEGEKKTISLCKELNIKNILIDEEEGFNVATMLDLTPIRTTSILIILLDKKIINFSEYKESLKGLSESGYFLDASKYQKLLNIGENIAKE